jgi:hypothetical protein
MTTERMSAATVLIIALLIGNLGLSAYIAFRPSPTPTAMPSKEIATPDIATDQAKKLSGALIPLYNQKDIPALYDLFDPVAKVQITRDQVAAQIEKLATILGRIEDCAYSHATVAGIQEGRTYYTLHYKVSLSGGQLRAGNMTLTVVRNPDGLGLFGFFLNGSSAQGSP